jgi:molybdopterin synthase catalytic subunit
MAKPWGWIQVVLQSESLKPLNALERWQQQLALHYGTLPAAECTFVGRVRGTNARGKALEHLELEHYPGMTEAHLEQLAMSNAESHAVQAVLVHHRVGLIAPGEAIVLVAVAADRRGPAQRCCQELLEALKHNPDDQTTIKKYTKFINKTYASLNALKLNGVTDNKPGNPPKMYMNNVRY